MTKISDRFCSMLIRLMVFGLTVLVAVACTKANEKYCAHSDECPEGYECNELLNRCEAEQEDAGVNDCSSSTDCENEDQPICDDEVGICRVCTSSPECERDYPARPFCDEISGQCLECLGNEHCTEAGKPICDEETSECRGCEVHEECENGLGYCEQMTRDCLDYENVVFVDCEELTSGEGTFELPYNNVQHGVDGIASGEGPYMVVDGNCGPMSIAGIDEIYIYSFTSGRLRSSGGADVVSIDYEAGDPPGQVLLHGLTLTGEIGHTAHGLDCSGATPSSVPSVIVEDSEITSAGLNGVNVAVCGLEMINVEILESEGIGVSVMNGDLLLYRSIVRENKGGGVRLNTSKGRLWSNMVVKNGEGVGDFGGIWFSNPLVDTSFWNNTVADNESGGGPGAVRCSSEITLYNSIFWGQGATLLSDECLPEYSLIGDASGGGEKVECLLGEEDPGFWGGDPFDYKLLNSSPCIDKGLLEGAPEEMSLDIHGEERVQGEGIDIGADEVE